MKVVICEDEQMYRKSICEKVKKWIDLTEHYDVEVLSFSSSEDFLEQWSKSLQVDLLFLDIQFGSEMNGLECARQIRMSDDSIPIVFITNYESYWREGYVLNALRYLCKPISYSDIAPCLDIAYRQTSIKSHGVFSIHENGCRIALRYSDILYFEARSPHIIVYTAKELSPLRIRFRFNDLIAKLPKSIFLQIHRSYIVNIVHVRCIVKQQLLMSNNNILPISKPYTVGVNQAFDTYYQGVEQ